MMNSEVKTEEVVNEIPKEVEQKTSNKKRPNIVLYTILMAVAFFIITEGFIWGAGGTLLIGSVLGYPKGGLVIREVALAALVLIVMLLYHNSYVFTQKKEKLSKGIGYGVFYLTGIIIFTLMYGVISGGFGSGLALVNLAVGCFMIGVCEEFLCRGWLMNEFLERFGDTKGGVWYSIIVSGIIFGLIHLGNIFTMGQSIPATLTQVISAAATGILFGLIYYKTKNIWSVVILHGLWDFSIFLSEVAPKASSTEMISSVTVISIIFSLLMAVAELVNLIPYLRDIDAEPKKALVIPIGIVSFIFYFIFTIASSLASSTIGEVYKYDSFNLDEYSITRDIYTKYDMKYTKLADYSIINGVDTYVNSEDFSFTFTSDDNDNLVLTNNISGDSVNIECEKLNDFIILEQDEYFVIAYVDYRDSNNPYLFYNYLNKKDMSNDLEYLENIKKDMKKYLLATQSTLVIVGDAKNDKSYVSAYDADYGFYVLVEEGNVSILNRDK